MQRKNGTILPALLIVGAVLAVVLLPLETGRHVASDALLASGSFNRTVSGGWGSADVGGSWTVLDSPASWSTASGAGVISAAPNLAYRAVLNDINVQDVDVAAEMVLPRCGGSINCDAYVLARYASDAGTFYRVGLVQGPGRTTLYLR